MKKIIFRSESERERKKDYFSESIWYTVVNDVNQSGDEKSVNPWNGDLAVTNKKLYLLDDCVVTLRPARAEDGIEMLKDYNKGYYFIEIMNQDESVKFSSHRVFLWENAIEYASWFKGLSFIAASRVWKVKKL